MLNIKRHFSKPNQTSDDIYNEVKWVTSDAIITATDGSIVFEQRGVSFPDYFSDNAIKIVSSKYLYGKLGTPEREYSLKQLISRVVDKIADEGNLRKYFAPFHKENAPEHYVYTSDPNSEYNIFKAELTFILLNQMAAFGSPIFFNVGTTNRQQISSCFLLDLEDDLEAIFDNAKIEGLIFRDGSGVGVNLSKLRAKGESIKGGGKTSGPMIFSQIYDTVAKATRSGGKNRRAARSMIMEISHPDIEEFITCKSNEEKKALILRDAGYGDGLDSESYFTVAYQNGNHSVMITDEFINAVENDKDWNLTNRVDGSIAKTLKAKYLWDLMATECWNTGDPGIVFYDHLQKWDTTPQTGPITTLNPCLPRYAELIKYGIDKFHNEDPVPTTMGELEENDRIWSIDGWTTVLKKWSSGIKEVYEYKTEDGKSFFSTKDHVIISNGKKIEIDDAPSIDELETHVDIELYATSKRIVSKALVGEEEVFDITVDNKSHTFWCNGFNVSNCFEYAAKNWTSCNLLSINLLSFLKNNGKNDYFDIGSYRTVIQLATIAMNILIDFGDFPTEKIAQETRNYRNIGIGYSNLGALLMSIGIPYDSETARNLAAILAEEITLTAYEESLELAKIFGTYPKISKENHIKILSKHIDFMPNNNIPLLYNDYINNMPKRWSDLINNVAKSGLRNSLVSLMQPSGTVSFMMDNQTTGIEPELALVKYKKLAGGGTLKMVNPLVEKALEKLGYSEREIEYVKYHLETYGTIEEVDVGKSVVASTTIKDEHIPIFDCAFKPENGIRSISPEGHVKMLGAIQGTISMASSKTSNLPNEATVEDIKNIYMLAWKLGVKCIAVYRDGCKMNQPMSTSEKKTNMEVKSIVDENVQESTRITDRTVIDRDALGKVNAPIIPASSETNFIQAVPFYDLQGNVAATPSTSYTYTTFNPKEVQLQNEIDRLKEELKNKVLKRNKLSDTRKSITHKCNISGQSFYITVGLYDDGKVGEVFLTNSRHGSFAGGTLDAVATFISFCLQYGAPLEDIVRKLKGINFAPNGMTRNKEIPMAKSILDYLGKYLETNFLQGPEIDDKEYMLERPEIPFSKSTKETKNVAYGVPPEIPAEQPRTSGQPCPVCGELMQILGRCLYCNGCGNSQGGCGS